eukprot:TRINITY_DN50368_c0_g1_i1.p1 TRINITY_DN50368_c0_g1~~TRINITY_DN50368_c0_g1_i1.p1  ORF type:complete len:397 (-),score=137.30 TRINITY_DN50368_c0_g1_i1:40-1230(-)
MNLPVHVTCQNAQDAVLFGLDPAGTEGGVPMLSLSVGMKIKIPIGDLLTALSKYQGMGADTPDVSSRSKEAVSKVTEIKPQTASLPAAAAAEQPVAAARAPSAEVPAPKAAAAPAAVVPPTQQASPPTQTAAVAPEPEKPAAREYSAKDWEKPICSLQSSHSGYVKANTWTSDNVKEAASSNKVYLLANKADLAKLQNFKPFSAPVRSPMYQDHLDQEPDFWKPRVEPEVGKVKVITKALEAKASDGGSAGSGEAKPKGIVLPNRPGLAPPPSGAPPPPPGGPPGPPGLESRQNPPAKAVMTKGIPAPKKAVPAAPAKAGGKAGSPPMKAPPPGSTTPTGKVPPGPPPKVAPPTAPETPPPTSPERAKADEAAAAAAAKAKVAGGDAAAKEACKQQ